MNPDKKKGWKCLLLQILNPNSFHPGQKQRRSCRPPPRRNPLHGDPPREPRRPLRPSPEPRLPGDPHRIHQQAHEAGQARGPQLPGQAHPGEHAGHEVRGLAAPDPVQEQLGARGDRAAAAKGTGEAVPGKEAPD